MKRLLTVLILTASAAVFYSCSSGDQQKPGGKQMRQEAPAPTVKTEMVDYRELQLYAHVTGKLEGITDIVLYSEVSGKVKSIEKRLGDRVNKGEPIASLDAKNYKISYDQAVSDLKSVEATLDAAKIKFETTKKLFEKGQVSKFEYTNDESSLKKAQASIDGAKANLEKARLNYDNSKFTSPVEGSISQINIKEGQYIGMGQPVASIVDCRKLIIRTGVTENDITDIRTGNRVLISHNGSGKTIEGVVTGSGKKPDGTGTYPVEIEIDNSGQQLLPGMIVEGEIESAKLEGLIYTDFDNLTEEFGKYFVYVVNSDAIANKREVVPGDKYGNYVVINKGISPGEMIVSSGTGSLSNGIKVKIYGK